MLVIEKEGRTEEEAIQKALDELQVTRDQVKIDVIEKAKGSFLGLGGSKNAKVRVIFGGEKSGTAVTILKEILKEMGVTVNCEVTEETAERITISIASEESAIIIGRHGKTLESLQFIINIILNSKSETQTKVILDSENYRTKRQETLERLAHATANQVIRSARAKTLEPMNPFERRIIHMALQGDNEVETYSIGEGISRRVCITPKGSGAPRQSGNKRYSRSNANTNRSRERYSSKNKNHRNRDTDYSNRGNNWRNNNTDSATSKYNDEQSDSISNESRSMREIDRQRNNVIEK